MAGFANQILVGKQVDEGRKLDYTGWLDYFRSNKSKYANLVMPQALMCRDKARNAALAATLARFQIGETGEGKHLKSQALKVEGPVYLETMDLFLREENNHADCLARVIGLLHGRLLKGHWTDAFFIVFRRALGLKTELFVLLVAEILGQVFYDCVAHSPEYEELSELFATIVADEKAHLEFHTQYLGLRMQETLPGTLGKVSRTILYAVWTAFFLAAMIVFIADNRRGLKATDTSCIDYVLNCLCLLENAGRRIF